MQATWSQPVADEVVFSKDFASRRLFVFLQKLFYRTKDTPALDVVPLRVDDLLEPGGPGAWVEHAISAVISTTTTQPLNVFDCFSVCIRILLWHGRHTTTMALKPAKMGRAGRNHGNPAMNSGKKRAGR